MIKQHWRQLLLISALTLLAWYKILGQSFMGEGYYYFSIGLSYDSFSSFAGALLNSYDAAAKILFGLFKNTLGPNIFLYQVILLTTIIFISVLTFWLVVELTGDGIIALVSAILFTVNFAGFEMYAAGNYQWFVQRVLALVLILPSIVFFKRFIAGDNKKMFNFVLSIFLYLLSFMLFHFSLFIAPIFFTLLLALLFGKQIKRPDIYLIIGIATFLFGPFLFLGKGYDVDVLKDNGILEFVSLWYQKIPGIFARHITFLSIPEEVLEFTIKNNLMSHTKAAEYLMPFTLVTYGLSMIIIFRFGKTLWKSIAFSLLVFIPIVFFFNLWARRELTEFLNSGSRYLYIPALGFSVYWGIFIRTLWSKGSSTVKALCILFVFLWSVTNIRSIHRYFERDQSKHKASKQTIAYISALSTRFVPDSIVIVPSIMSYYGADYLKYFYGASQSKFEPYFSNWANELPRPFDPKKDFILNFDEERQVVVDRTAEYKEIIDFRTRKTP